MKLLVFLQNAWSPVYAGRHWPRRSWLRALASSRSGMRLRLLGVDLDDCHNVSTVVTKTSRGKPDADPEHVLEILQEHEPDLVVCCGRLAEETVARLWGGALLALPHPASRVLQNAVYERARRRIRETDWQETDRVAYRLQVGAVCRFERMG